jgi:hypothetical protein
VTKLNRSASEGAVVANKIYLVGENKELLAMEDTHYAKELDLQRFLAEYWELLPGEQINPDSPRRWLLVKAEMTLADSADSGGRWSVDHLFLDQDGIPTLVETKRSSDIRMRRDVIGQILEYAANAVIHWPLEKIQADFLATCDSRKEDSTEVLRRFLKLNGDGTDQPEESVAKFWNDVKTNLSDEKIRLVLVGNEVPPETQRVIEFLNGQMARAEILAVELKQFIGQGRTALVPRVLGQTVKAVRRKSASPTGGAAWTEQAVLDELDALADGSADVARELMNWINDAGGVIEPNDKQRGNVAVSGTRRGTKQKLFTIWIDGKIQLSLGAIEPAETRSALVDELNRSVGLGIREVEASKFPSRDLSDLAHPAKLAAFRSAYERLLLS